MGDVLGEIAIRIGKPDDVDDMMDIAASASDENGFVTPSPSKMLRDIWSALNRHKGLMGLIGVPGEPTQAAVLLRIGEMWYSDDSVVEEKAIFVRPEYRRSTHAKRLCEFSKSIADGLGIPLVIGVLSNQRTAAKIRLYERQFGPACGAFFLYGTSTGKRAVQA